MSDVSDEDSIESLSDGGGDVNPALRQLKSQMDNYRSEMLTDDESGNDDLLTDDEDW